MSARAESTCLVLATKLGPENWLLSRSKVGWLLELLLVIGCEQLPAEVVH